MESKYQTLLSQLLGTDSYLTVNKLLIKIFGLTSAVLLTELLSEYNYYESHELLTDEGEFYSTRENIREQLGLTDYEQRGAEQQLKNWNVLTTVKKGLPAKNYYKIDFDKLLEILTSSSKETLHQETKNPHLNNNKQNISNKNTKISINRNTSSQSSTNFLGSATKSTTKSLYEKCTDCINDLTQDPKLRKLLHEHLNMVLECSRESNKPLYSNVYKGKLKLLKKFPVEEWETVIKRSIENGWLGFYENGVDRPFNEPNDLQIKNATEDTIKEREEFLAKKRTEGYDTKF